MNISKATAFQNPAASDCPWTFSFQLVTHQRIYDLFAPTAEERDLWVNALYRLHNITIDDPSFEPMQAIDRTQLAIHE
jgi:hypothetical protein